MSNGEPERDIVRAATTADGECIPNYDGVMVHGYINPLAFFAVDEPWKSLHGDEATEASLLEYLCRPDTNADLNSILNRYREVSKEVSNRIFVAPTSLLKKLVWPLRHAKGSFALGNYFGTIALCGMVAEMAALLIFEPSAIYIKKHFDLKKVVPSEFRHYFKGDAFEREGQQQRVRVLNKLRMFKDPKIKEAFDLVRDVRNRYLHLLSQPIDKSDRDAAKAFLATVDIVRYAMGLDVRNGKVAFRPEIFAWIEEHAPAEAKAIAEVERQETGNAIDQAPGSI